MTPINTAKFFNPSNPAPSSPLPTSEPPKSNPGRGGIMGRVMTGAKDGGQNFASGVFEEFLQFLSSKKATDSTRAFADRVVFDKGPQDLQRMQEILQLAIEAPGQISLEIAEEMPPLLQSLIDNESSLSGEGLALVMSMRYAFLGLKTKEALPKPYEGNPPSYVELSPTQQSPGASHLKSQRIEKIEDRFLDLASPRKELNPDAEQILNQCRQSLLQTQAVVNELRCRKMGILPQVSQAFSQMTTNLCEEVRGLVSEASHRGEETVSHVLKNFREEMTTPADCRLVQMRKLLKAFVAEYTRNPNGTSAMDLALRLRDCTILIAQNEKEIFKRSPLSAKELQQWVNLNTVWDSVVAKTLHLDAAELSLIEQFVEGLYRRVERIPFLIGEDLHKATVEPGLQRLEEFPARLLGQCIGGQGAIKPSAEKGPAGGLLTSVMAALGSILSQGAEGITQRAFGGVSRVLYYFIDLVAAKIGDAPQFAAQRAALDALKAQLSHLTEQPSLENLRALHQFLVANTETFNSINIYVNNIKIPGFPFSDPQKARRKRPNPRAILRRNLEVLRKADAKPDLAPKSTQPIDWKKKTQQQKDLFTEKTVNYVTAKVFCEKYFGIIPDTQLYIQLLNEAKNNGGDLRAAIAAHFKVSGIRYQIFRFVYFFAHCMIKGFIKRASNAFFEELSLWIQTQKQDNFRQFTDRRIQDAQSFLSILNDAFKFIATRSPVSGTISQMLKEEMSSPQRNHNRDIEDIYGQFAQNVIRKGMGNPLLAWLTRQFMGSQKALVRSVLDTIVDSLKEPNGYYALNTALSDVLRHVLEKVENGGLNTDSSRDLAPKRKEQLSALVKNLFEILGEDKAETIQELIDIVQEKSLKERMNQCVDSLFINDVIQSTISLISASIENFSTDDQWLKLACTVLEKANKAYDLADPASNNIDDARNKEAEVQELISEILHTAVSQAVDRKLNATQREQARANEMIVTMRQSTQDLLNSTGTNLTALKEMDFLEAPATATAALLVKGLKEFDKRLDTQCTEVTKQYKEANTRKELLVRIEKISQLPTLLNEAAGVIKKQVTILGNFKSMHRQLQQMKMCLRQKHGITPQVAKIKSLLEEFTSLALDEQTPLLGTLQERYKTLQEKAQDREIAKKQNAFAKGLPLHLDQFINAKRNNKKQTAQTIYTDIHQDILNTFQEGTQRTNFINALKRVANSLEEQQTHEKEAFLQLARTLQRESFANFSQSNTEYGEIARTMILVIDSCEMCQAGYVNNKRTQVAQEIENALYQVNIIGREYEKALSDIIYVNFMPIDLNDYSELIEDEVYKRTWERADGLRKLADRDAIYSSLITQLIMDPYNAFEREHRPSTLQQMAQALSIRR